jgi:hypothetical protein
MRWWWLGPVVALAGCGTGGGNVTTDTVTYADADTDTDSDADTDTEPAVTGCFDVPISVVGGYGASGATFRALHDGDAVQFTHGPQGGWHIEGAVQVDHTDQAMALFSSITVVSTGVQISGVQGVDDANSANVLLSMSGECAGSFLGLRAYLDDVDPDPDALETLDQICALDGQELDITWTATDLVDQRSGTASVRVIAQMDPTDLSAPDTGRSCADYD